MANDASGEAGALDRPQRRHMLAAVMAGIVSLFLHGYLISRMPPLKFGRPATSDERVHYRAFELQRSPARAAPAVREPARFRPEDPAQVREIFGDPEIAAAVKAADLPVPKAPKIPVGPLTAQDVALSAPALPTTRTPWEPRQDILQVEDALYGDNISALPRRLVEKVERSHVAPDIVFAADPEDINLAGGFGSGAVAGDISVSRPLPGEHVEGGAASAAPAEAMPSDVIFPGETSAFDEEKTDITPLQAAEQYLALDVSTFQSPEEPGVTYFEVRIARQGEQSLPVVAKDVLFLQDCSESMTAWKLAECKAGLRRWLDALRPGDRFEIIGFRETTEHCFNLWASINDKNKNRALDFIGDLRAEGDTDVYASLSAALAMPRDPARPLIAILVTDGRPTAGTTDSSDIIEAFTQASGGNVSMFSFGAGRRANRFLLDMISYRNRGDSRVVVDMDRIPSNMEAWSREMNRPVLSDLVYRFTGMDETQVFPTTLTHLYLDRALVIYGRTEKADEKTAFQIVGRNGSEMRDMVFQLDLESARPGDVAMRTQWAWNKIYDLIGRYIQTRQASVLAEINNFAQLFRLDVPYGADMQRAP